MKSPRVYWVVRVGAWEDGYVGVCRTTRSLAREAAKWWKNHDHDVEIIRVEETPVKRKPNDETYP